MACVKHMIITLLGPPALQSRQKSAYDAVRGLSLVLHDSEGRTTEFGGERLTRCPEMSEK